MIFLVYQSTFKKEMWCTSGFVKHALALFTEQSCCLQLENGFDGSRISAKGNKNNKNVPYITEFGKFCGTKKTI